MELADREEVNAIIANSFGPLIEEWAASLPDSYEFRCSVGQAFTQAVNKVIVDGGPFSPVREERAALETMLDRITYEDAVNLLRVQATRIRDLQTQLEQVVSETMRGDMTEEVSEQRP